MAKDYRDPIFGLILIIVAIFLPQGIAGLFQKGMARLKGKTTE
jgi:ABC-type branched-subunit amino acid transport system permease subunit